MYIRCADLYKCCCITGCGDTQFNVNFHMRKSVFPRTRFCTVLSELPHVEIHKSMCKSAPAEIRFSPRGNSHEIVHFRMWKYTKNYGFPTCGNTHFFWISTCGNSSGKVNFRMSIYKWIREFPWGKHAGIHDVSGISTCGNTHGNVNSRVRKYTRKGVLPQAVIH